LRPRRPLDLTGSGRAIASTVQPGENAPQRKGAADPALRSEAFDMRRVLLAVVIAVAILAVPVAYNRTLPAPWCPEGWWCELSDVESGLGWVFLPASLYPCL
jgi:hypothetical protein